MTFTVVPSSAEWPPGSLSVCSVFLAWMEQTTDVLGGKFEVSGGRAIYSDGEFYWLFTNEGCSYIRQAASRRVSR